MKQKVLMVGLGAMGSAMASVWKNACDLVCIDPSVESALSSITQLPLTYKPDVIVLAVKPQLMEAVMKPYVERFHDQTTTWVSVAAGLPTHFFKKFLGETAIIVRAMPNLPFQFKHGVTCLYAPQGIQPAVEDLFALGGYVTWLDKEEDLHKVTAISGSGPAYFYYMVEALTQAAVDLGLSAQQANELARQTAVGAAVMLDKTIDSAATLRGRVTSPKGTTEAALKELMGAAGLSKIMNKTTRAAFERSEELEKMWENT